MIKIENVVVNYETTSVGPYNLTFIDDAITSVIGPSGAGKSTLIKAITKVNKYDGKITYHGKEITKSDYTYITQSGTLFNHLTIKENLSLTVDISDGANVLTQLGLNSDYLDKYPFELSGGEKQRIDIARAILAKVKLLFLDEAFNALDTKTKDEIYGVVKTIQKKHKMLIINITHDLQEAVFLSEQIILVDEGKISFIGTPKELLFEDNESVKKMVSKRRIDMLRGYYADNK